MWANISSVIKVLSVIAVVIHLANTIEQNIAIKAVERLHEDH